MNSLSPRERWVLDNTKPGKILHVGFAGSNDKPDILFAKTVRFFPKSVVYGVDINASKVKKLARENTYAADGKNLPFKKNNFDCVVLAEVLEHHASFVEFLTEAHRVLKKQGVLLITTPNPYGIFRWLKNFVLAPNITVKNNVNDFLGYHDHEMFLEPISLAKMLYETGFRRLEYTSTNPSYPYFPPVIKEFQLPFWPYTRLGTTSCFKSIK